MNTYTDEYLNYWADRYVERGVALYGVPFLIFLAHPHLIEEALSGDDEPLPLLQSQRLVAARELAAERAEHGAENMRRLNGAPYEALHHRAWPRKHQTHLRARWWERHAH